MLPLPHGGRLIERKLSPEKKGEIEYILKDLPKLQISKERAKEVENISMGLYSPIEGFMTKEELHSVLFNMRLPNDLPWTIPIVLDVPEEFGRRLGRGDTVVLLSDGTPIGLLDIEDIYSFDKEKFASHVFGTTDRSHPGVERVYSMNPLLLGGKIKLINETSTPFKKYKLTPKETRVLFEENGWKTVVGFQTRNVPHVGHEYVQKTALTFVDGIFINPVIGKKKIGDFKDEVILAAYEALIDNYYLKGSAVMAIWETEMRYAGPREAIFHAIVRKNFGCTHFIVGRDHAGVGNFYHPYAAQEIFDKFPDLGITPVFFKSFFYCKKCGGVVNERICPHGERYIESFSGTKLRRILKEGTTPPSYLIRPEVFEIIKSFSNPFVE
jgi:sulfate adenylyltransferase